MCVGRCIHYMNRNQDIRLYYGIYYIYPLKSIILISSILRLCGFPFLIGYYSKDLIIGTILTVFIFISNNFSINKKIFNNKYNLF